MQENFYPEGENFYMQEGKFKKVAKIGLVKT